MTKAKAEKITGCEVKLVVIGRQHNAIASEGGVPIATVMGYSPAEAYRKLVEKVYKILSARQREAQRGRCANCGELRPLEIDHIRMRSHGRDDRQIRALCVECHQIRHRRGQV